MGTQPQVCHGYRGSVRVGHQLVAGEYQHARSMRIEALVAETRARTSDDVWRGVAEIQAEQEGGGVNGDPMTVFVEFLADVPAGLLPSELINEIADKRVRSGPLRDRRGPRTVRPLTGCCR